MEWTLLLMLGGAWLLSPVILLIALIAANRRLDEARRRLAASRSGVASALGSTPFSRSGDAGQRLAALDLDNALLLRQELRRLRDEGDLSRERYQALTAEIDRLLTGHLSASGTLPGGLDWQRRRAEAWSLLTRSMDSPPGPAPWTTPEARHDARCEPLEFQPGLDANPNTSPGAPKDRPVPLDVTGDALDPGLELELLSLDPLAFAPEPAATREPVAPAMPDLDTLTLVPLESRTETSLPSDATWDPASPSIPLKHGPAPRAESRPARVRRVRPDSDWQPAVPSPLEEVMRRLSGWPRLIVPFLLQNIGWFVGAFCFVSGALFLIANTEGFVNALVVFASLTSATAFLLWAGYRFRRQGDSLVVASSMLLTLGMLLAPLDLLVAIRLLDASGGDVTFLMIGLILTALTLAGFAWAAALSSALMDPALRGRYPWLLTALAATQLAAPLASVAPDWRVLALLHLALLALLAIGLSQFARAWLRRLFVDQRLTTYFAAGLLTYTATLSFIHLTWSWPVALPRGYAGPFLIAVCALLFQVDAAFKEWVEKYTFLSRFSLAIYALSMVAIALALPSAPALFPTLALGALLYAWVTWRYRTPLPLFLLLGCLAGLYALGILDQLPPAWHELASLPGLLALLGVARWARPRSRTIALQALIGGGGLLIALALWSLVWSTPGWLGLATGGTAALLLFEMTRLALGLPEANPRWTLADIGVMALATLGVALAPPLAPPWTSLAWEPRTAFALLGLAALWSALALRGRGFSPLSRRLWTLGALASIGASLALGGWIAWSTPLDRAEPILLLLLSAALLLWLSLGLRRQSLFYGVLVLLGVSAVLIKRGYFPGPSSGMSAFLAVMALWPWLAWMAWRARRRQALRALMIGAPEQATDAMPLETLIRTPLERAMALLWVLGLVHFSLHLLNGDGSPEPLLMSLGVISGLVLLGHFQLYGWMALPFLPGLAGLLMGLERLGVTLPWLGAAAVLYVLLIWRIGTALLARPLVWRLAGIAGFTRPEGGGGRHRTEASLRALALLVTVLVVAVTPLMAFLGQPTPELLPALTLSLLLFVLMSWEQASPSQALAALLTLTLGIWLLGDWMIPVALPGLGQPLTNSLLSLVLSLAALRLQDQHTPHLAHWQGPLRAIGGLLYLLALAGALLGVWVADPGLPMLLAVLCLVLFPVTRLMPHGADWRGLVLALLLGGLIWSSLAGARWHAPDLALAAILWGYALWLLGNLALPRFNRRWPDWAVTPLLWPLLGLPAVLGGAILGNLTDTLTLATALAVTAPYLLLLMRNSAWPGLAWLATGLLTASGALAAGLLDGRPESLALTLLWCNLLFLLARLWRRFGQGVASALAWRAAALEAPLFWLPFVLLAGLGLSIALEVIGWRLASAPLARGAWILTGLAALLALSAGHALWLRPGGAARHLFILALTALAGAARLDLGMPLGQLPLGLALWSGALLLLGRFAGRDAQAWRETLNPWLILLPALAILLLLFPAQAEPDWGATTLTLVVLAGMALAHGWWLGAIPWLKAGLALSMIAGYSLWMLGAGAPTLATLAGLTPWYGLQTLASWLGMRAFEDWLYRRMEPLADHPAPRRLERLQDLAQMLSDVRPWMLALGLLWLGWHGWILLASRIGWGSEFGYLGLPLDALAAMAALLIPSLQMTLAAWRHPEESGAIERVALLLAILAGYARLAFLGLAPFTPLDTTVLLAGASLALLLHRLAGAPSFARLALLLPLLALATTPWALASTWTGGTLLATSLLYLSLASRLRNAWPLYLGILALNGAIYLWAPLWAERFGLWQFHIAPAAISVLVLLHLHRRELRPSVLSGARLAALSLLYAGAGLDLFLRPELMLFVFALALALTGILLGIALRIRAFLYAGLAFLVLNVLGQLLRFYPDQGIGRALILLTLGALITGAMVVFNLKREAILRRVRILRADLAEWE